MDIVDIAVASLSFLTAREKLVLRRNIDSLEQLAVLSIVDISRIIGRVSNGEWNGHDVSVYAEKSYRLMEAQDIHGVRCDEADFPALLREIPDLPYMLFWRGNLKCLQNPCVSVIGTREICRECAQAAFDFSKEAAQKGFTVVSGLAQGADAFAHKGALSAEGSGATAAVLPSGIDIVIPSGHKVLAKKIIESGGVLVSEYIPGTPAKAFRFVQRNRITAALSPATIVVQAPAGSGTLITTDFALDYNRDVFVHQACFCDEAKKLDEKNQAALRQKLSGGKKKPGVAYKLENTVSHLVNDGAPIIKNFADFLEQRNKAPGSESEAQDLLR